MGYGMLNRGILAVFPESFDLTVHDTDTTGLIKWIRKSAISAAARTFSFLLFGGFLGL